MKAVIQTVEEASVKVDGITVGQIERGMLVYFGVEKGDEESILDPFLEKLMKLRIFKDANGKMNLNLASSGGDILIVSQFTLAGDIYKGNRPGFETAAGADLARSLYDKAVEKLGQMGYRVQTGLFGAHMKVAYVNDGPETFILESDRLLHKRDGDSV